jgi:bifunctional non-homologous end joining protein LigD
MGLKEYKKKRDFKKTPEPAGKNNDRRGEHRFVIQKHDASHLHYDFRLEMEGVLKSWAVPKGPSMDPSVKRLAMMVEDHPVEYGKFEGIIPEGNYGAGTVMIWDEGTYHAVGVDGKEANEKALVEMLHKGNIKIAIEGKKLKGEFALVHTKSGKGNQWLLIKHRDKFAGTDDITKKDKSVVTNRSLEEIEKESGEGNTVWSSKKNNVEVDLHSAVKSPMPHNLRPMLATLVDKAFDSEEWIFEIKWDGYRAIAECNFNTVELYSRNNLSFNKNFPEIVDSLRNLGIQAILDGEIVVVNEQGMARFDLIQNYHRNAGNIIYYVFDIIYYNGYDLSNLPLTERKEILKKILPDLPNVRYNDHIAGKGMSFYSQAKKQGIEGIIAKRADSIYQSGCRSKAWLKVKTEKRQEAVICGFTEPRGGRKHLGALVLGVYKNDELVYIGHTGGGFNEKNLQNIYQKLKQLEVEKCPFNKKPKTNTPVTWVMPQMVCEVKFQEWTSDGRMRIPVFIDLRVDKDPKEVKREVEFNSLKLKAESEKQRKSSREKGLINKDHEKTKNKISESNIKSKSSTSNVGVEDRKSLKRKAESENKKKDSREKELINNDHEKAKNKISKSNIKSKGSTSNVGVEDGKNLKLKAKSGKLKVKDDSSLTNHFTGIIPEEDSREALIEIDGHPLKLTNLDKIYWPDEGYTKGDMIRYYEKISDYILPYLKDRLESLRRSPEGAEGFSFFQKDMPATTADWILQKKIWSESNKAYINYMFCQNKASLIYMANLGCIEINPWNSRIHNLDKPDYIVIDLDPQEVPFKEVTRVAQVVKEVLDRANIQGYCKTSGSRGLHIYIPMNAKYDYDQAKNFAHVIAGFVHDLVPDITSLERMPAKRKNKIYIDFLQNRAGQTLAAPYCLRPKPAAKVSTPLTWDEVNDGLDPAEFNIQTIFGRLKKMGDIFKPVLGKGADPEKALKNLGKK